MGAQQVPLGAVPIAGAPPVHPGPPVAQFLSVALAAELVGDRELDLGPAGQVQPVPVVRIMAVQAPAAVGPVIELDFGMHVLELPPLPVDLQVLAVVADGAGEHPFGDGRRGHLDVLGAGRAGQGSGNRARPMDPHRSGRPLSGGGRGAARSPGQQRRGADLHARHGHLRGSHPGPDGRGSPGDRAEADPPGFRTLAAAGEGPLLGHPGQRRRAPARRRQLLPTQMQNRETRSPRSRSGPNCFASAPGGTLLLRLRPSARAIRRSFSIWGDHLPVGSPLATPTRGRPTSSPLPQSSKSGCVVRNVDRRSSSTNSRAMKPKRVCS